ncbi:MAG: tyrosine transporter [Chlamydia sp. 32-24]|nr:MAG: tyrosine transporter [Chlamydia sp. 32-24]
MNQKKISQGSVLGAILLVAGCSIGAGILGLPVLSASAGLKPTILMFFFSWALMLVTSLLLLEVNLGFTKEVSIVSMAEETLGTIGKAVSWFVFLFLFYSLMVAFIAGSAELFHDCMQEFANVPHWIGSFFLMAVFAIVLYLGTLAVDRLNRLLMFGLIVSYALLLFIGFPHIEVERLYHVDWSASLIALPAMIVCFGYHNLIPSLTTYLNKDRKRLIITLVLGSIIPLILYLLWETLMLGLIPIGKDIQIAIQEGDMTTSLLKRVSGQSSVLQIAQYFAFFSIVTSFLGVALSFVDFLADGLKIPKNAKGKVFLCSLVLFPPWIFSIISPHLFLKALGYAGGYGAVVLFGILPALMVWSGRYFLKKEENPIVPGGKIVLSLIIMCSLGVFATQFYLSNFKD